MEGRPEHTVEYRSIDYYSMCEKSKAKIKAMHKDGLCTRCVVQTSPGNYQAWVRVAKEPISQEEAKICAQLLANRKHNYMDEHGRYPFTQLYKPSMRAVPHNVINTEVFHEAQ